MEVTTINGQKTATTHTLQFPRLNEPAPDFEARTTHGTKKLSDYRGRYLVLFSHPGSSETSAVRAVFVIDDKGILRAMIYYPKDNGRSIPEVLRLVKALQTTDEHRVATPEGWQPGDKVVVPPPTTAAEAEQRMQEADAKGYDCVDWYLCKRAL